MPRLAVRKIEMGGERLKGNQAGGAAVSASQLEPIWYWP